MRPELRPYKTSAVKRAKAIQYYAEHCEERLAYQSAYWWGNVEANRARRRKLDKENRAKRTAITQRYRKRHPDRAHARNIVTHLLAGGKLVPLPCQARKNGSTCGAMPTQAHHSDYSQPLDVTWLCQSCHNALRNGRGPVEVAA